MPAEDRIARLNCQILRELGLLGEVILRPHISDALVTFTGVELASNLRTATVYFSVYGGAAAKVRAGELLKRKRVALQEGIARKVPMKYTPVLHFRLDETAERADRVLSILNELNLPQGEDAPPSPPDAR
ncbi:MAG: ribosome-binding factor A [Oligosphaeraceae bacterium]